jgi:hypothetical protein
MDDFLNTAIVQKCLDRLQAGDASARQELLQLSARRLNGLAGNMLGALRTAKAKAGHLLANLEAAPTGSSSEAAPSLGGQLPGT